MPSTLKAQYGSDNQTITITLASLANSSGGSAQQSSEIDNTANLYLDALVLLSIKTGSGGLTTGTINVYAFGSVDSSQGSPHRTEGAGASNNGITLTTPPNARLIGIINAPASSAVTYNGGPFSVAAAFGGILPEKWGIIVQNQTGTAFDATAGNHFAAYQGILAQGT
jgi:hypothetical protein